MTADPKPILDYASPHPRSGRVRLPAQSMLRVEHPRERDGTPSIRIHETLTGRSSAVGAIVFGCFILFVLAMQIVPEMRWTVRHHWSPRHLPVAQSVFFLLELLTMLAVIHNTWRKTIVHATARCLRITFTSPFHRRVVQWPAEAVMGARVERVKIRPNWDGSTLSALAQVRELQLIAFDGRIIHLFAGHTGRELQELAEWITRIMDLRHSGADPSPAGPPLPNSSISRMLAEAFADEAEKSSSRAEDQK